MTDTQYRVARHRRDVPPLWRVSIFMFLVLLYTLAVASIAVSVAEAKAATDRPAASSTWHPPLKQPGPDWAMRQFHDVQ